jgi:anti-anti-sigma factor
VLVTVALTITHRDEPASIVAHIAGDVDLAVADRLRSDLEHAFADHDGAVVLDLTATTYLDSSGVRLLFDVASSLQRSGRQLALLATDEAIVRRVLVLSKLDEHVPVANDLATALAAVAPS